MSKFNVGLKTLLQDDLSGPDIYEDLIREFKKIAGKTKFSEWLKKYNMDILRLPAWLISLFSF